MTNVVPTFFEQQGIGRNRFIPSCPLKYCTETGLPKLGAGKYGASAWCAGRYRNVSVSKNRSFPSNPIEVGGAYKLVDGIIAFEFAVSACVPPPVVCKQKDNVGSFLSFIHIVFSLIQTASDIDVVTIGESEVHKRVTSVVLSGDLWQAMIDDIPGILITNTLTSRIHEHSEAICPSNGQLRSEFVLREL